jgi:hypothetical protein
MWPVPLAYLRLSERRKIIWRLFMNADLPNIPTLGPWDAQRRSVFEDLTFSEQPYVSILKVGAVQEARTTIAAFGRLFNILIIQHAVTDM